MLKKFLSAILSVAMVCTLFGGVFTASAADVKLDDELTAAKNLGFLSASQESRIDKAVAQTEVVEMISAAVQKRYGKTGKFLADRKTAAGSSAATRHYYASTLYFAMYEQINSPKYYGYSDYMLMANAEINEKIMPDAAVVGVRKDGSIGELNLFDDCADIGKVQGDDKIAAKYQYMVDYGADSAVVVVCALYDRVTGLPVMALDSKNNFNPQNKMTVGDAARATLRFYRSLEGKENYVKLSKAGTYNKKIITSELLNKESSLPEASNQKLPVWRGILNCTMGFVKYQALGSRADKVIREGDIKAVADTGFNHMSIMISFPWLQGLNQKDGYVDKTRLEELDRVIALCMKYDIHVTLENCETPGTSMWDDDQHENGAENLAKPGMAKTYASYWGMLAKRYKGIDNKYLAFNLMVEPGFTSEEQYEKLLGPSVKAIFAADKSRVVIADIHNWGLTGEAMAKMGVALSHHHYEPRDFCVLEGTDNEWDKNYLQSVKWNQTAKDTFDLHAYGDENIASLNDVRKTAEKYGVGFMVGEFGIFGGGQLSKYRYSDKTLSSFYTSMTKAFEAEGIGWVGGSMDSQWGVMTSYPCVEGASYVKLENSTNYYDQNLGAIFKKVNGVPSKPSNVKAAKSSGGKAVISWKKVSGAEGYEVYMATSKSGEYKLMKTLKGSSKVKLTVSVAAGKTYYFKVRSYKTVDGRLLYSDDSNIGSVAISA